MEILSINHPLTRAYFYKSGVVFKINNDIYSEDPCVLPVYQLPTAKEDEPYKNEDKIPYFMAKNGRYAEKAKYFLDVYITPGDTYETEFKKTIHSGETESSVTFADYYKGLCEKQIVSYIMGNGGKTYDELFKKKVGEDPDTKEPIYEGYDVNKLSKIGVPLFVLKQAQDFGYSATSSVQIDLTEDKFDSLKENAIIALINSTAENLANRYLYKATCQSGNKTTTITIEKQGEQPEQTEEEH